MTYLPDNKQSTAVYSKQKVTTTDPSGKQRMAQADGLGRMLSVFEPDVTNGNALTVQTSYTYDVLNDLTGVTQGAQTRVYGYDALGRLTNTTTPEGGTVCFGTVSSGTCNKDGYDSFNNLLKRTDPRGVVTTYSYDTLNRPTSVIYNVTGAPGVPATSTVSLAYGPDSSCQSLHGAGCIGRLITMTDGVGSENYTYNNLGQMTQLQKVINSTTYTTQYQYNLAGEVTQATYPSNRSVQQSVDAIGRLCAVATSTSSCTSYTGPFATGFGYNTAMQVTGFSYGNGVNASFSYTPDRLLLQSLSYTKGTQTLYGATYSYAQSGGNNGQIAGITDAVDTGRNVAYTYDALARLSTALTTGSTGYPQWGLSWTYDRYGNRTAQTATAGSGLPQPSFTVSATTNQITTTGYAYDASGNMTSDGLNTITYDAENRVVSSTNSVSAGAYVYDGNGLRVKKCLPNCTNPTTWTVYIYAGHQVIAAYDNGAAVGSPSREYILAGGTRLAKIASGSTVYYHRDQVSTRLTTDANGNVLSQQGHYPFGENWYQSGATPNSQPPSPLTTDQQFTTYQRDTESGNDYALAREFVNRLGRFSALDPMAGNTSNPQSLNRYAYAANDPIDLLDPEGEYACVTGCGIGNAFGGFDEFSLLVGFETDQIDWPGCPYGDCSASEKSQIANSILSVISSMQPDVGTPSFDFTGGLNSIFDPLRAQLFDESFTFYTKPDCMQDFANLGITPMDFANALLSVNIVDGTNSDTPMSSLYAASPNPILARNAPYVPGTVGGEIGPARAMSQPGGNTIYMNALQINPLDVSANMGTLLHETAAHIVAGLTDSDAQRALGIPESPNTSNITTKLQGDCLN